MVEILYSDGDAARLQGLFWRQFCPKIFKDPSGYLMSIKPGIIYYNDFQKNDACAALTRVNNRVILPLDFDVPEIYKDHPSRKHFSIAKLFSMLLGVELTRSDSSLPIADPNAPVFPDLSAPLVNGMWQRNISAKRAQIVRRQSYRLIYPDDIARCIGQHQYRGARCLELLALGVPAHIVAQLGRWRSIEAMLHYLSSDVSALIGFAHLKPSCGMRKSEFSGIAWFYANHRMFGESGRMIAKRLKQRRITNWYALSC